jgi:hypothetical protein
VVGFVAYVLGTIAEPIHEAILRFESQVMSSPQNQYANVSLRNLARTFHERGMIAEGREIDRFLVDWDKRVISSKKRDTRLLRNLFTFGSPHIWQDFDLIADFLERIDTINPDLDEFLRFPIFDDDYEQLRARLMATQGPLYGEYDRLVAESEFRFAVTLPLVVVFFQVATVYGVVVLFTLPLMVLVWRSLALRRQADMALVASLSAKVVSSPYLEHMTTAQQEWNSAKEE